MLDAAAHFVRAPEDHGRAFDVAGGEELARTRRRVRDAAVGRVFRLRRRDEPEAEHLEVQLRAHALQQRDVAVAAVPEVEVGADHHETRAEHTREHRGDEVFGGFLAARFVEREHEAFVDGIGAFEQLQLLIQRGEQLRRRTRPHHLRGMAVEREHGGCEPARVREVVDQPQHRAMPEMHTVERADRDRASDTAVSGRGHVRGIAPHDHDDPCGASTTVGFTPAPRRS